MNVDGYRCIGTKSVVIMFNCNLENELILYIRKT